MTAHPGWAKKPGYADDAAIRDLWIEVAVAGTHSRKDDAYQALLRLKYAYGVPIDDPFGMIVRQNLRDAALEDDGPIPTEGPTPREVAMLGKYSSMAGTWWDENRTHIPHPPVAPPLARPTWRICGAVSGRAVADGEGPTCGACRQILRIAAEKAARRGR